MRSFVEGTVVEMKQRASKSLVLGLVVSVCILMLGAGVWDWLARQEASLPYDHTNPVLYDNDEAVDMYTDEYLLALASLGDIKLNGMITSSPIVPYDPYVTVENYERDVSDREALVANAQASGFVKVPDRVRGPMGHLQKPASGRIEDTHPIGATGSWVIVTEARKASAEKPVVVVVGAPLTAEADAYLLDPSIANKMVVAWLGGQNKNMCDYNGWADPWAAYIVLQKLRLVEFPLNKGQAYVPKHQLMDLPNRPLRDYMYRKHHPKNSDPGDIDGDGPPAISLIRPDYPLAVKRVAFKRWVPCSLHMPRAPNDEHEVPAFYAKFVYYLPWSESKDGRALVVERSDPRVATREWWRAITNALSH
jgi:hypothetical protein